MNFFRKNNKSQKYRPKIKSNTQQKKRKKKKFQTKNQ